MNAPFEDVRYVVSRRTSALAGNVWGVDVESGASLGRTQNDGAVWTASRTKTPQEADRQNSAKVVCRGTKYLVLGKYRIRASSRGRWPGTKYVGLRQQLAWRYRGKRLFERSIRGTRYAVRSRVAVY